MFVATNLENKTQEELLTIFNLDYDLANASLSDRFVSGDPIKLLFVAMNSRQEGAIFFNTYVNPKGVLHSNLSKEEAAEHLRVLKPHKHNFIELMFVMEGEIYVNIENTRHLYTKGSGYIVNRNVIHMEEYNGDFRLVFLQLSDELLQSIYGDLCLNFFETERELQRTELMAFLKSNLGKGDDMEKDYLDFVPQGDSHLRAQDIHSIFERMTHLLLEQRPGGSIEIKGRILELFYYLMHRDYFSTTPVRIGTDAEYQIFSRILSVMTDTHGRISRSQLAERLNYSGNYLNEISRKYSGLALFDLGMVYCMKEAARLLNATKMSIGDIALELGFSNRTHFYKIFKETYNMTPAEYRRR